MTSTKTKDLGGKLVDWLVIYLPYLGDCPLDESSRCVMWFGADIVRYIEETGDRRLWRKQGGG